MPSRSREWPMRRSVWRRRPAPATRTSGELEDRALVTGTRRVGPADAERGDACIEQPLLALASGGDHADHLLPVLGGDGLPREMRIAAWPLALFQGALLCFGGNRPRHCGAAVTDSELVHRVDYPVVVAVDRAWPGRQARINGAGRRWMRRGRRRDAGARGRGRR